MRAWWSLLEIARGPVPTGAEKVAVCSLGGESPPWCACVRPKKSEAESRGWVEVAAQGRDMALRARALRAGLREVELAEK